MLTTLLVVLCGALGVVIVVLSSFLVGLVVLCISVLQLYFAIVVWFYGVSVSGMIPLSLCSVSCLNVYLPIHDVVSVYFANI